MSDYYGYASERDFQRAYENEVYCPICESHPCRCEGDRTRKQYEQDQAEAEWETRRSRES